MIEPLSDDNGSSPLSEVEDADGEELDQLDLGDRDEADQDNDTEAETERLHDTPHNPRRVVMNQFNEQVFERTPTKLRQEKTTHSGDDDEDDDEPLSEEESIASSPPIRAQDSTVVTDAEKLQSPTLDMLAEAVAQEAENRKRKRSSHPAEQPDIELSPRKRPSPEIPVVQGDGDGDVAMADEEEEASTNTNSGEHSADEGVDATIPPETRGQAEQPDDQEAEVEIRKQTRSGSRKQRGPVDEKTVDGNEHGAAPNHAAIEEDSAPTGDEHMVDVDEEAEAAHRNEEELERKRTAFEQLTSIEERFAAFRTKFYDEKLEQLNQEEAALRSDNPTHPEYLAMMQCIDARRDEKLRIAEKELELNMEALERWAVARRSQVHSQFYQSVRESRERTLAELGQHWYDIQHERRKHANNVPDFGIRYPQSHNQRIRNALAYNKEVSILSGIAKYEGMPAAPNMCGASLQELDDDFEAMTVRRLMKHSCRFEHG
ncbi:Sds3-like-domain-containing protein [Pseudomassariella vexata]|uniref:Sds3-like-domain-containing protein n=1 Tax=Pseudomassariella vexata TaxID=1141098 RepID=A0A1Y2DSG7_9PEZI|nr:Sds3-like-domain-containing protein [Pseudomassariella vexata]ORY62223.1 Sds3-like-domain-containing protein [Pseudomassariella vexata]